MSQNLHSEFETTPPKETNIHAKHAFAGGHASELEEVHDTRIDCIANFYRTMLIVLSFIRIFLILEVRRPLLACVPVVAEPGVTNHSNDKFFSSNDVNIQLNHVAEDDKAA